MEYGPHTAAHKQEGDRKKHISSNNNSPHFLLADAAATVVTSMMKTRVICKSTRNAVVFRPFSAKVCSKLFKNQQYLNKHVARRHPK